MGLRGVGNTRLFPLWLILRAFSLLLTVTFYLGFTEKLEEKHTGLSHEYKALNMHMTRIQSEFALWVMSCVCSPSRFCVGYKSSPLAWGQQCRRAAHRSPRWQHLCCRCAWLNKQTWHVTHSASMRLKDNRVSQCLTEESQITDLMYFFSVIWCQILLISHWNNVQWVLQALTVTCQRPHAPSSQ